MAAEQSVERWLLHWQGLIRRRDYDGARHLFADDVLGFGTFADVTCGLDDLEASQWRRTWPRIEGFRFDVDSLTMVQSDDGGWRPWR